MQIGISINKARKDLGLSRENLAEKIGVSTSTVMRWEKETIHPSFESVVMLSKCLHKPLEYFSGEIKREENTHKAISISDFLAATTESSELISLISQLNPSQSKDDLLEDMKDLVRSEIKRSQPRSQEA